MSALDAQVAVIGGGVVGCAVLQALASRGVEAVLLEAQARLASGASGANSGILHTGFDSQPGELETRLILRSSELRAQLSGRLGVPVSRCGALLRPSGEHQRAAVARLARNAVANGVEAQLHEDGSLEVPGEAVTDPAVFVRALAARAQGAGATVKLEAQVGGLTNASGRGVAIELAGGERVRARAAVNCAGLYADELARLAGDELPAVYPRKGEFLVFSPAPGQTLDQILPPVPSALGKGVLVFPTVDGRIIAGPTAREREDKSDWSVEPDAAELILPAAMRMYPALEGATQIAAYAGLRPAGRGANYLIERSRALPPLVHVAAIRSTGLSASLGIGEHVAGMLAELGAIELGASRPIAPPATPPPGEPWWQSAACRSESAEPHGSTPATRGSAHSRRP